MDTRTPAALAALALAACAQILDDDTPYVSDPRVLAVQVEPAEAVAGQVVRLTALYADASGDLSTGPLEWSFCVATRPLAELGPVAPGCLEVGSDALRSIGTGVDVEGAVPVEACSLFGPNPPPPVAGEASGRPTDPDVTGGFYQPVIGFRSDLGAATTLVPVRVRCGIANVSQETYVAWNQSYRSNVSPEAVGLAIERDGDVVPVPEDGRPTVVAPGEVVALRVGWPECPSTGACGDAICSHDEDVVGCSADCTAPRGCHGAETYVVYEATSGLLEERREAVSVTWFATKGTFDVARNGRSGAESETTVHNEWTAPTAAGEAWIAVVLRDERGGVSFASFRVTVGEGP